MSHLFPELRGELVGAMARGPRRRSLTAPATVAVAVAAAAALAFVLRPHASTVPAKAVATIDVRNLPSSLVNAVSDPRNGQIAGTPRPSLNVYEGGQFWTVIAFASRDGAIALARTEGPDTSAATSAAPRRGPVADVWFGATASKGRAHYLVSGLFDARVAHATVRLGDRRRGALLSPTTLKGYRLFAAGFTVRLGRLARPVIDVTLADGSTRHVSAGPFPTPLR